MHAKDFLRGVYSWITIDCPSVQRRGNVFIVPGFLSRYLLRDTWLRVPSEIAFACTGLPPIVGCNGIGDGALQGAYKMEHYRSLVDREPWTIPLDSPSSVDRVYNFSFEVFRAETSQHFYGHCREILIRLKTSSNERKVNDSPFGARSIKIGKLDCPREYTLRKYPFRLSFEEKILPASLLHGGKKSAKF